MNLINICRVILKISLFLLTEKILKNFRSEFLANFFLKVKELEPMFSIQPKVKVKLKMCDRLGSEIETLVNKEKPAATYEANFDASALSSEIYLYRIESGNFVQTKKMILLK